MTRKRSSPSPPRTTGRTLTGRSLLLAAVLLAAGCASTGPSSPGAKAPSERATLGIEGKPIPRHLREKLRLPESAAGVLAGAVFPDGPAALAGVRPDDIVEQIGGENIAGECEFAGAAFNRPPGPVNVVLRRGGTKIAVTLSAVAQDSLLEKSCRAGVLGACFRQAWTLASSRGESARQRSAELYDSACRSGSADACAYRGTFLMREDNRESAAVLERACELGSAGGCASLAFLHATGKFVPKDDRRAATLYTRSCGLGDAQGCYNEGLMADDGRGVARDLTRALARYREACDRGSAPACTNLGFHYEHGKGVLKDASKAAELYQRGCDGSACHPSNRNGCVNLGRAYRDGIGVAKDPSRAAPLFRDACDGVLDPDDPGAAENRSRACSLLGALYIDGDGVEKDGDAALRLSELGCGQGDSFGCFNAAALAGGDPAKASSFLEKACELGDGEGCFDLGVDYEKGRGVSPDRSRAAALYRKACELGFREACAKK